MLTDPQIWLLKAAQRLAGLDDAAYRQALMDVCHVTTSKDPSLSDEHLDTLLSYFEAIYWKGVDEGRLQLAGKRSAPFQQRGYWAGKNKRGNTSRDRYTVDKLKEDIEALERQLTQEFGCGFSYFMAIQNKVIPHTMKHGTWPAGLVKYKAALERTLEGKRRKARASEQPF